MSTVTVTHGDDFDAAILESMDDAIRSLLSQDVLDAFHSNLIAKRSIRLEEIPRQLPTVSIVLKKYFGPSAETIEKAIAKRLYSKYGLEIEKNEKYELTEYVRNARSKLKPAAPSLEPTKVNLPLQDDFDPLFLESVKEAIQEALGEEQAKLAFHFWSAMFGSTVIAPPTNFFSALKKNFGKDSGAIETASQGNSTKNLR